MHFTPQFTAEVLLLVTFLAGAVPPLKRALLPSNLIQLSPLSTPGCSDVENANHRIRGRRQHIVHLVFCPPTPSTFFKISVSVSKYKATEMV